ncbi:MAG: hypothetical protein VB034_09505 [Eubacteriales bacterium]|nr:hypothetical protein [Petrimonas sp.]MEA5048829.1 hypothetical protein [Eubacteriales bacterium]
MQISKRRKLLPSFILILFLLVSGYQAKLIYDQQFIGFNRAAKYLSTSMYAKVLRLDGFNEESILREYGKPSCQVRYADQKNGGRILTLGQYLAFDVLYVYADWYACEPYNNLILLVVKDDSFRFGRLDIGIGSTREDVRRAYGKDPAISAKELAYSAEDYPNVDEGFYGEDWCRILFCYDDNGVVESMAYQPPAF